MLCIVGVYSTYIFVRIHWAPWMPSLGIPASNPNAQVTMLQKVTSMATNDALIKVIIFLPLLFTTRYLRDGYDAVQRPVLNDLIARRIVRLKKKGRAVTTETVSPPWFIFIGPWRTAYRYHARLAVTGLTTPVRMPAEVWRRFFIWAVVVLLLSGLGTGGSLRTRKASTAGRSQSNSSRYYQGDNFIARMGRDCRFK